MRRDSLLSIVALAALGLGVSVTPSRYDLSEEDEFDRRFAPMSSPPPSKAKRYTGREVEYAHIENPISKRRKRRLRGKGQV